MSVYSDSSIKVLGIDDCNKAFTAANRAAKADVARLGVTQTALATAEALMKASLAALKESGGNEAAKDAADAAVNVVKAARNGVKDAQSDADDSQHAADVAKAKLNQALAARSRREFARSTLGFALPLDDPVTVGAFKGAAYVAAAKQAFADVSSLEEFPVPSVDTPCTKPNCVRSGLGPLCPCSLKACFAGMSAGALKSAKGVFNPDQFEDNHEFQDKAYEVCAAISKAINTSSVIPQSYQKADRGYRSAQDRANNRKR